MTIPHAPWNGRSSYKREGALGVCVGGDFKERKVSRRTFNIPLLQGESWLLPGLRIILSFRDVLQDRETAISLEMELQQAPVGCKQSLSPMLHKGLILPRQFIQAKKDF